MTTKKTEMTLHEKLVDIQKRIHVPKAQTNEFGGYKFRSAEDILAAVKPLCNEHGLTLCLDDEVILVGDRFYIKTTAVIHDGLDGFASRDAYAREPDQQKGMSPSQLTGGAASYAAKRALGNLFAIDDTRDADTQKPVDPNEPMPNQMLDDIKRLLEEAAVDVEKFLEWARVNTLHELPIGSYETCVKKLRTTIAKNKKG